MNYFRSITQRVRPGKGRSTMDSAAQRKTAGRAGANPRDNDSDGLLREIICFFPGILERTREQLVAKAAVQPVVETEPDSKSLRSQCFLLFEFGQRPADVARWLKMKPTTAVRYYQAWKRCIPSLFLKYKAAQHLRQGLSMPEKRALATALAGELNGSPEEVLSLLGRPWSTKRLVTGEWRRWRVQRVGRRQATASAVMTRVMLLLYPRVRDLLVLATNQDYKYVPKGITSNEERELLQDEPTGADPE